MKQIYICGQIQSMFTIYLRKDKKQNVLEPITGMDIPFSSPAGASSVVRVPSTGGFGGVMLQEIKEKKVSNFITFNSWSY